MKVVNILKLQRREKKSLWSPLTTNYFTELLKNSWSPLFRAAISVQYQSMNVHRRCYYKENCDLKKGKNKKVVQEITSELTWLFSRTRNLSQKSENFILCFTKWKSPFQKKILFLRNDVYYVLVVLERPPSGFSGGISFITDVVE